MMLNPFGAPPFATPDFEAMQKSWSRATPLQKISRVGIVGGIAAAIIYAALSPRGDRQSPQQPPQSTPSRGRGTHR